MEKGNPPLLFQIVLYLTMHFPAHNASFQLKLTFGWCLHAYFRVNTFALRHSYCRTCFYNNPNPCKHAASVYHGNDFIKHDKLKSYELHSMALLRISWKMNMLMNSLLANCIHAVCHEGFAKSSAKHSSFLL